MHNDAYDLKSLKLPRLAGPTLKLVTWLVENPLSRGLIANALFENGGINYLRAYPAKDPPTFHPHPPPSTEHRHDSEVPVDVMKALVSNGKPGLGFAFKSASDYFMAYQQGAVSPIEVAERLLAAIEASNAQQPALRAVIACKPEDVRAQARASAERWQAGRPLGPLDGVPVVVKDEVDLAGFATFGGTSCLGERPAEVDARAVARLRAGGALLAGKANMHEIGIGVTGFNQHHGTARNPYHLGHHTGGSSSGPAASVAAGLAPLALGADGGGSIRIPAAFCGLVGLKPTFGRVSEQGALPLCWSVAHIGPIAATARDAALGYLIMAGPDQADAHTHHQPAPSVAGMENTDLSDLTIGIYWPWFQHATGEVVQACEAAVQRLQAAGARLQEVTIPELEAARVAHMVTITSEMAKGLELAFDQHRKAFSLEVRYDLAMARLFTARDYLQAQCVRTRTVQHFERAFQQVDVILTPATALTAPAIPPSALDGGESDISLLNEIMRFATPANLTGHPAISFPVGYDSQGLPIGLQAIGRYWEEHTLLRLANTHEQGFERRKPALHYDLL